MSDRDMRPTRLDVTLEYSRAFVTEWFDQNPLGQIGVVCMRNGLGERIVEMSGEYGRRRGVSYSCGWLNFIAIGNPQDILKVLSDRTKLGPSGDPSLQNSIELAKGSMRCVMSCDSDSFSNKKSPVTFQRIHLAKWC